MLSYLRQLAGESVVYGVSGILSRFLSIFFVPIYTRLFTPEDYGVMSLVSTSMAVVTIFAGLALENSAGRWYWATTDEEDHKRTVATWAWTQLVVATILALVVAVLSKPLSLALTGSDGLSGYLQLAAAALPLSVLGSVTVNWLRLLRRPWTTTIFTLVKSIISIAATFLFVVIFRTGISGVYLAEIVASLLGTLAAIWLLQGWIKLQDFDWGRLREMLRFALPLLPAGLSFWVVNAAGRYFVEYYSNTTEVGLFQVGSSIAALIGLAVAAFQFAWSPFALSIHKQDDAGQVYASVLLAYTWIMSLGSVALAVFAPDAIRLLATEEYVGASSVVGILAFSSVLGGMVQIASMGASLVWKTSPVGIAVTAAAGLTMLLNAILTPALGMTGSALATLVAQASLVLYLFIRSQQLYPIPYRFWPVAGLFLLAILVILLGERVYFQQLWLEFVVKIALVGLFVPALFALRIVNIAQVRRTISSVGVR